MASTSNGIFVGSILVFVVAAIAALMFTQALWFAASVAFVPACAFNAWAWRRAEICPIPKGNAQAAATVGWFLTALYALFALLG